jgi:hypothetical protein
MSDSDKKTDDSGTKKPVIDPGITSEEDRKAQAENREAQEVVQDTLSAIREGIDDVVRGIKKTQFKVKTFDVSPESESHKTTPKAPPRQTELAGPDAPVAASNVSEKKPVADDVPGVNTITATDPAQTPEISGPPNTESTTVAAIPTEPPPDPKQVQADLVKRQIEDRLRRLGKLPPKEADASSPSDSDKPADPQTSK